MISYRCPQKMNELVKMPGSYLWMCLNVGLSLKQKELQSKFLKLYTLSM